MHLYNAWLPPPVAAQTAAERDSFARIIADVKSSFRHDDPDSVFSTIKYISVLDLSVPFSTLYSQFQLSPFFSLFIFSPKSLLICRFLTISSLFSFLCYFDFWCSVFAVGLNSDKSSIDFPFVCFLFWFSSHI